MKNNSLINQVTELVKPIVSSLNYDLYHIEYVRENGENYLRIYIDSENGIGFQDCEKVSRRVSDTLDEKDPIEEGYYLEVSSPGIFRTLYTEEHMNKYKNNSVTVKLNSLYKGKKSLEGILLEFDSENVYLDINNERITVPREKIKVINLNGEL